MFTRSLLCILLPGGGVEEKYVVIVTRYNSSESVEPVETSSHFPFFISISFPFSSLIPGHFI